MSLDSLPKELIAHIATFVEALSILNLSLTSKIIRAACWDSLVFKEILQRSQRLNWRDGSLNLEAIAKQAGTDQSIWARYAVADDKAWVLAGMKDPLLSRRRSINFLPELAVIRHPFLKQGCWCMATHGPFDYLTSHVYSLTMAVLSADETGLSRFHDPGQCEYCFPKPRENDPAFLSAEGVYWTLCSIAIILRDALKMRRSVWPYNHAANVPHIDFPRADKIPLRPLHDGYGLPVPFSRRAVELLGRSTSSFSGWDSWYRQHSKALHVSPDFLTTGSWCGYYTWRDTNFQLDPPMTGIRFQRNFTDASHETALISAEDCVDGVGKFGVRGSISWDGNVVTVTARKNYTDGPVWDWDCRLTPFGIVGHWGSILEGEFRMDGYVWLWKEEWNGPRRTVRDEEGS